MVTHPLQTCSKVTMFLSALIKQNFKIFTKFKTMFMMVHFLVHTVQRPSPPEKSLKNIKSSYAGSMHSMVFVSMVSYVCSPMESKNYRKIILSSGSVSAKTIMKKDTASMETDAISGMISQEAMIF